MVQLIKTVDPKDLFTNYLYFSSVTKSIVDHSKKTSACFIDRFKLNHCNLVLEIGSNDGVNLQFYKEKGMNVLGIDPAKNIAEIANKKGIKTIPEFFNLELAKKLSSQGLKADLIYGANVFAHVPNIVDFVKGVKTILKDNGTCVFEFPYLKGLLENKFDTIYHEHVFYYSLIALKNLFNKVDLGIYDVEQIPMQGGSLRIFISHKKRFNVSQNVKKLQEKEIKEKYNKLERYMKMAEDVNNLKKETIKFLKDLKSKNKSIAGYGAPAKGIILLNFFKISRYLNYIVDKSPVKQNKYVPGIHFLIYSPSKIRQEIPDYLFIFPWNIKSEILSEYSWFKKQGGKFIIPIPRLQVI
ncbi:MAG: class I SAM-dependent methyltransferase [Candidatus Levyibacteriota bacterium]